MKLNSISLKRSIFIISLLFSFSLTSPSMGQKPSELNGDKPVYTLAIPPLSPPVQMYKEWGPFIERLSKETGTEIQLKVYNTISALESDVIKGVPDFAFTNPYHMVLARKAQGYIPLVRDKTPLVGILVVHKDSPINSIQDLNGKEIAFPAPNA